MMPLIMESIHRSPLKRKRTFICASTLLAPSLSLTVFEQESIAVSLVASHTPNSLAQTLTRRWPTSDFSVRHRTILSSMSTAPSLQCSGSCAEITCLNIHRRVCEKVTTYTEAGDYRQFLAAMARLIPLTSKIGRRGVCCCGPSLSITLPLQTETGAKPSLF